jgi:hypothetical protein
MNREIPYSQKRLKLYVGQSIKAWQSFFIGGLESLLFGLTQMFIRSTTFWLSTVAPQKKFSLSPCYHLGYCSSEDVPV